MKLSHYTRVLVTSTLLLVMVLGGCSDRSNSSPSECVGDGCKRALIDALEDLGEIQFLPNDDSGDAKRQHVRQIVERFREPRQLATFALLTRAMQANCGGDAVCSKQSVMEPSYENAFWYCIELLEGDRTGNQALLLRLKEAVVLNDTELGEWGRVVEGKDFP